MVPPLRDNQVYTVAGIYIGEYWLHDPRIELQENVLEQPLMDGGVEFVPQTLLDSDEMEIEGT